MRAGRRIVALGAIGAALASTASAGGATPPPYNPTGHFKLSNVGAKQTITAKFIGTLPTIRKGEYTNYYAFFEGSPPAGGQCNNYALDTIGQSKPKHTSTFWDPGIGMEWPSNETPKWCKGTWFAQAFVMTKRSDGAYHARRSFARKTFTIG